MANKHMLNMHLDKKLNTINTRETKTTDTTPHPLGWL